MADLTWISQEAHKIHDWFQATFYLLITVFLLLGVVMEYFKLPLGGEMSFGNLIGRALIAAILLHIFPEVANIVNDISSALSSKLGDLSQFTLALDKMGKKLGELNWSWTSARQSVIVALSYLCFFLLYFSVHVAQALYLYSSVLLYIFSPILIALFLFPQTAGATSGLFRSLIEVSLWKPVWCIIATLIWSSGISDIQGSTSQVSFLSSVCFCLIAAGSLMTTPMVVHSLASGSISSLANNLGSIGVPGIANVTAMGAAAKMLKGGGRLYNAGLAAADFATRNTSPRANQMVHKAPPLNIPSRQPVFAKWKSEAAESPSPYDHSRTYGVAQPSSGAYVPKRRASVSRNSEVYGASSVPNHKKEGSA